MLLDKTLHAHATGLQSVWNAQNGNAETGGNENEETERTLTSKDRTVNTNKHSRAKGVMYSTTQKNWGHNWGNRSGQKKAKRMFMTQRGRGQKDTRVLNIIFTRAKYM